MMPIFKPKEPSKQKEQPGFASRLDRELPFVVTLVTIMAASGISPFGSFMKLARYRLLPNIMIEARKIVNMVHILGEDPLTAMEKRANGTKSRQYRDLLLGYVSTVRNGGDIADFLQSKMQSVFEFEVALARQSIAKIGGLVDAYMIMQVIGLSLYVVVAALTSLPTGGVLPDMAISPAFSYLIVFVLLPVISLVILFVLDKTVTSTLVGAKEMLLRGAMLSGIAIFSFALILITGILDGMLDPVYAFPLFLVAASAWPAYKSLSFERNMKGMESELPSYLRDIAESRKAGLSPEKSIIYASDRLRNPDFHAVVRSFSNQLEWGVPLRKIYENLAEKVKSRMALIHFRILIEAIESGGGYTASLDILAKSSEAVYNIENEKKSMLKPYFYIAFMVTALMSITTLMVSQTFVEVSQTILPSTGTSVSPDQQDSARLFAIGITAQSWLTGFLVGKISTGSFAAGFKYAIMLVAISTAAAVVTLEFNLTPSIFLNTNPAPIT